MHGAAVSGSGSRFSLDVVMVSGDDLRLDGAPTAVFEGQTLTSNVCGPSGQPYDNSRVGLVELDFGVPSSVVRVPVYWSPRIVASPTPTPSRTVPPTATFTPEPTEPTPGAGTRIQLPLVLKGR